MTNFWERFKAARKAFSDPRPQAGISSPAQLATELSNYLRASSGAVINNETAMKISAVFACVKVLSETIASLPLNVYRRLPNGGKEQDRNSKLDRMLHISPNRWQTSFEWREMMMAHCALRGNAYSMKLRIDGELDELIPLHPDRVKADLKNGEMLYTWTRKDGRQVPIAQRNMFHLKGMTTNGETGRDLLADGRDSMGLAASQEKFASSVYRRGGLKHVLLKHPKLLNGDAAKRIAESFDEKVSGEQGFLKPVVLEEGLDAQELSLTAEDLQLIASRQFQVADIARIFRVPLHMINELSRSTNNNIETQSLEFLTRTMMPWFVRWEQTIQRDLIGVEDTERFAKFNANAIVRGDIEKRGSYYQKAILTGWLNIDDVRDLEDKNPLPDGKGKIYYVPLNVVPVGTQQPTEEPPAPEPEPQPAEEQEVTQ